MPVLAARFAAARFAADCFEVAIEAVRIATQYMTPVMLLTDGYIAIAAEPRKVPDVTSLQPFPVRFLEDVPEGGFLPTPATKRAPGPG